jgi:hypothetical protein
VGQVKFVNPDIESSYHEPKIGEILFNAVIESRPKVIVDFGLLYGYSTVCLGMAAKHVGAMVYSYDIFEDYPYNKSDMSVILSNVERYNLQDCVRVEKKNFFEWIKDPEHFDMLHVDISNTGETVEIIYNNLRDKNMTNGRVFFEGGSKDRDLMDWMVRYNKKTFSSIASKVKYTVLREQSYVGADNRIISPSISEILFAGGDR